MSNIIFEKLLFEVSKKIKIIGENKKIINKKIRLKSSATEYWDVFCDCRMYLLLNTAFENWDFYRK